MARILTSKRVWIPLVVLGSLATLIVAFVIVLIVADKITLPGNFVSAVSSKSTSKDIFSRNNLLNVTDEWGGLNGDGEMIGTFRLSESATRQLLTSSQLIQCERHEECQKPTIASNLDGTTHCQRSELLSSTKTLERSIDVCVNADKHTVQWEFVWY